MWIKKKEKKGLAGGRGGENLQGTKRSTFESRSGFPEKKKKAQNDC